MISTRQPPPRAGRRPGDPLRAARLQRDAAFERSRSITKAIGFASVAAVAVFGVYVARAFPGHTTTPSGSTSAVSGSQSTGGTASNGYAGNTGGGYGSNVAPPSAAPSPSYSQAPVVSGSS